MLGPPPPLPPELLPALFGEPPELLPALFGEPPELIDPPTELPELPPEPPVELLPPSAAEKGVLDWPLHATGTAATTATDRNRETTAASLEFISGPSSKRRTN